MALLSDNQTLMVVLRVDGNDGGPPYCSVRHTPKNYLSVFSSDGGYTWTQATPMRDINGRGMGTAYPRLLRVGNRCVARSSIVCKYLRSGISNCIANDGVSNCRLLLSGGRLFTESVIDIELWVNSDGMGRVWDQVHSLSYEHNRVVVNPLHRLFHQVNLTDTTNSTTSYTSLVPFNEDSALVFYECYMVSSTPGVVGAHGFFSMRITLA